MPNPKICKEAIHKNKYLLQNTKRQHQPLKGVKQGQNFHIKHGSEFSGHLGLSFLCSSLRRIFSSISSSRCRFFSSISASFRSFSAYSASSRSRFSRATRSSSSRSVVVKHTRMYNCRQRRQALFTYNAVPQIKTMHTDVSIELRFYIPFDTIQVILETRANLLTSTEKNKIKTRMWANAQHNGRRAEYRRHPLLNAAKFG